MKVIFFLLFLSISASSGDRESTFINCLRKCEFNHCRSSTPLPLSLKLTFWSCPENCRYTCMHDITDMNQRDQARIHQYYGKWPFYRIFGIQEPASVVFSILNGLAHRWGYIQLRKHVLRRHEMRKYYILLSFIAMNAWFWSTIFHARDTPFTEKMDYFSAMAYIIYAFFIGTIRIFNLETSKKSIYPLCTICIGFFLVHITYLTFWPFDYTYNMTASIIIGVISNILWLYWCSKESTRRPYVWKMVSVVLLLSMATGLEVLDFSPIFRVFDAHSLWHAATIPITFVYYDFLIADAVWEIRQKKGKGRAY